MKGWVFVRWGAGVSRGFEPLAFKRSVSEEWAKNRFRGDLLKPGGSDGF